MMRRDDAHWYQCITRRVTVTFCVTWQIVSAATWQSLTIPTRTTRTLLRPWRSTVASARCRLPARRLRDPGPLALPCCLPYRWCRPSNMGPWREGGLSVASRTRCSRSNLKVHKPCTSHQWHHGTVQPHSRSVGMGHHGHKAHGSHLGKHTTNTLSGSAFKLHKQKYVSMQ